MYAQETDIQNRIVVLVKGILEQNSIAVEVTPSALLVDIGLTSMDMVNLMLGVEAEFDFMIPQEQITPENFQSDDTLVRLVAGELGVAQAALVYSAVIARSGATKQSRPFQRRRCGLLRFARNDEAYLSVPNPP